MSEQNSVFSVDGLTKSQSTLRCIYMRDMNPYPLNPEEWRQIMDLPAIREAWGLQDDATPSEFASNVYGVKFKFFSGSPGYVGDLYILQGDALTGHPPIVLRRAEDGALLSSTGENGG
jgi:hypothetical protein